MKKRAIAFVICLFILVALAIVYIFSELFNEDEKKPSEPKITDAMKFKEEYESLNGQEVTYGETTYTYRTIKISKDNPFVYATEEDILKKIDKKESFIVYFGFAKCPWCRSVLESVIKEAKQSKIKTIYYVDVTGKRDVYTLDENNKPVLTTEGTKGYMELISKFADVLDDYTLSYTNKKKKTVKVEVGEKRIYAPSFILVKNGEAKVLETAVPESIKDPYQEIDDVIKCEIRELIGCVFDQLNEDKLTCDLDAKQC